MKNTFKPLLEITKIKLLKLT